MSTNDVDFSAEIAEQEAVNTFLAHYGVKGMRWGQRKNVIKEDPSEDSVRVGELHGRVKAQRSTKPLSNKELETAIKRMQLEQQYSKLSGGLDKNALQKAGSFIQELATGSGKNGAQQIANQEAKKQFEGVFNAVKDRVAA